MKLPPFQALIDEHMRGLHRFLCGMVGWADGDDCLQETLLAALLAYPRLRDDGNLRGWLYTIARHKAVDHLRNLARKPPVALTAEPVADATEPVDHELWDRVTTLPTKQRTAIALRFLADLPYAEVAVAAGTSVAAARQNVRAGLQTLRRELT